MRDLSMHLMDIMRNSVEASASEIKILVKADEIAGLLELEIADDGCGMTGEMTRDVTDPFVTSRVTRKVGLGIPMFEKSAVGAGGYFRIESKASPEVKVEGPEDEFERKDYCGENTVEQHGTIIKAAFGIKNIDRPPLGDIAETLSQLITAKPDIRYMLEIESIKGSYDFDTDKIKEVLNGVPISEPDVIEWIAENIEDGVKNTLGGVLDEIA